MNEDSYQQALSQLRPLLAKRSARPDFAERHAERTEVYDRFQSRLKTSRLAELSAGEFRSFLVIKNNKHWDGIHRQAGKLVSDMPRLREALRVLLDETRPIAERLGPALDLVPGLGMAVATPLLHVAYPDRYGVWNKKARDGVAGLGLWPDVSKDDWVGSYPSGNEILLRLAEDLGIDLWTLDWLWEEISLAAGTTSDSEAGGGTPTFLFLWNPARWTWDRSAIDALIARMDSGDLAQDTWSTGNSDQPKAGDRFFLVRVGTDPRGIFASGRILSTVQEGAHYDAARAADGDTRKFVQIRFDELLNPWEDPVLSRETLAEALPQVNWAPQSSGSRLSPDVLLPLEELWQRHLRDHSRHNVRLATSVAEVRESARTFQRAVAERQTVPRFSLSHPDYFVEDADHAGFAPAKWCGLRGMTPETYSALQTLRRESGAARGFDGARTRTSLEKVLAHPFESDPDAVVRLRQQFESAYGNDAFGQRDLASLKFVRLPPGRSYWWVNQGKTYEDERAGGYIRAHERNEAGAAVPHWINVGLVRKGDLVFHYAEGAVRAVSEATADATVIDRPGDPATRSGDTKSWQVALNYRESTTPVALVTVQPALTRLEMEHGPFDATGGVKQGYLYKLSPEAADVLLKELEMPSPTTQTTPPGAPPAPPPVTPPTNLILFGPPGTGKTYTAIAEAVRLCDGTAPDSRSALQDRFRALQAEGRIRVVTFHQSYSYEEFVEGIRPVLVPPAAPGSSPTVSYEVRDGAFKLLCQAASARTDRAPGAAAVDLDAVEVWKMSLYDSAKPADERILDTCLEKGLIALGYGDDLDFAGASTRDEILKRLQASDPGTKPTDYAVTAVDLFRNRMAIGDLVVVSEGLSKIRAIGRVTGDAARSVQSADEGMPVQVRPVQWLVQFDPALPRERLVRRALSQMTIYTLRPEALNLDALRELLAGSEPRSPKSHVLIIDEINRGNVAKVMGELITLLEPDKRIGMPNEVRVTLPYSGEEFGVPANLHVVGTMNTADRSITFLDTALRRRFEFREMLPDADVVRRSVGNKGVVDGIDVARVMEALNGRLEVLYDRDHTIGHSYFLGCRTLEDLRTVFRSKVIPLLQEYFYDEWPKLCAVLGCARDADTDGAKPSNAHPMIAAEAASTMGLSDDNMANSEASIRFRVNPAFDRARGDDLRAYFEALLKGT